jgi:hypothetical protein
MLLYTPKHAAVCKILIGIFYLLWCNVLVIYTHLKYKYMEYAPPHLLAFDFFIMLFTISLHAKLKESGIWVLTSRSTANSCGSPTVYSVSFNRQKQVMSLTRFTVQKFISAEKTTHG